MKTPHEPGSATTNGKMISEPHKTFARNSVSVVARRAVESLPGRHARSNRVSSGQR